MMAAMMADLLPPLLIGGRVLLSVYAVGEVLAQGWRARGSAVGPGARLWHPAREFHGSGPSVGMIGKAIDEDSLRLLLSQHAVRECKVARHKLRPGRWTLEVRLGGSQARWIPLRSQREPIRTWASLDTLERFATAAGLLEFTVEL
jgi:hypothetical protein